jgi:phage terminase large subunit GpA-like protein
LRWTTAEYRDLDGNTRTSGSVVWEGGSNATPDQIAATAGYQCGECRALWSTLEKNRAVARGRWAPRTTPPARPAKVGYHASRLLSLFPGGRFDALVADWINAQETPLKLQSFLNSVLAEPWVPRVSSTSGSDLAAAVLPTLERGVVPDAALAITIGIDSQLTGFPWAVYAWMRDRSGWLIDHGKADSRQQLEEFLFRRQWRRQNGQPVGIWRVALDCGGGRQAGDLIGITEANYRWLAAHGRAHGFAIWGVRGSPRPMSSPIKFNPPMQRTPSGRRVERGLVIVDIDTDVCKTELHQRWQWGRTQEPGGIQFHKEADDALFRQLLAEELRERRDGTFEWVLVRRDNHWLDCSVYAIALGYIEFQGGLLRLPDLVAPEPLPVVHPVAQAPQPPAAMPHHRIIQPGNPWLLGRPNPFGPRK